MRSFIIITLLAWANLTYAAANPDTMQFTFTAPTTYEDGSPFDMATQGSGFRMYIDGVALPQLLGVGDNFLELELPPGLHCGIVHAISLSGVEGNPSNSACKEIEKKIGPSTLTVTIIPGQPPTP